MINWQQIDTVFLDMDGTLLDLYFDNHFWLEFIPKRYAEEHGLSYAEADKIMDEKYQRVIGTMDWYCVDYWSEQLSLDIEALKREIDHYIAVHPYVEVFLQYLHASDMQVWLVTNAHQKSLNLKMQKPRWINILTRLSVRTITACPKKIRSSGNVCWTRSLMRRPGPCWWKILSRF